MKKTFLILVSIMLFSVATGKAQHINDNQLFDIQKIDSVTFFTLKEKANIQKVELEEITDFEQAKKMLEGRVIWGKFDEETGEFFEDEQALANKFGNGVYKIMFRNGKTYLVDYPNVSFFIAYFPQEDVLLLEGGHTSDVSFNLTTGEEREDVGVPWYYVYSPSKKYRLNGYDDGQECAYYFIQEKIDGQYQRIISLYYAFQNIVDFRFCWILDAFWENDTTLNIITTEYPDERYEKLYYRIILK